MTPPWGLYRNLGTRHKKGWVPHRALEMTKVGPSRVLSVHGPPAKTSTVHRAKIAAIRRISLTMMPSIYDHIEGNSVRGRCL